MHGGRGGIAKPALWANASQNTPPKGSQPYVPGAANSPTHLSRGGAINNCVTA
jgi:hypothetical protein